MNFDLQTIQNGALVFTMIFLAICVSFALVRAFMGPRFTDSLLAINVVNVGAILMICILAVYLNNGSLVDIAIVYSMIGFLSVVVLARLYLFDYLEKKDKKSKGGNHDGTN